MQTPLRLLALLASTSPLTQRPDFRRKSSVVLIPEGCREDEKGSQFQLYVYQKLEQLAALCPLKGGWQNCLRQF